MKHCLPLVLCLATLSSYGNELRYDTRLPAALRTHLQADLVFVGGLYGRNPSDRHFDIFRDVSGTHYMSFFSSRIESIRYSPTTDQFAFAFVNPGTAKTMFLTDNFLRRDMPQTWRVGILFHEARHAEPTNDYWRHINCPRPFRGTDGRDIVSLFSGKAIEGIPGCDNDTLGSYGTTATMLGNIHKNCTNCTQKVKDDAELLFQDSLRRYPSREHRNEILQDLGRNS